MNNEIIGITATVVILIGFMLNGEVKIRIFDMIGAALFILYGVLIGSLSNILLNGALIVIHLVKLRKFENEKNRQAKKGN